MKNIRPAGMICLKTLIIASMLPFFNISAFSQNDELFVRKIDSLKSILSGSTGVTKQEILFQIGYEYLRVDDSVALPYSTEAFNMSWQFGDSLKIVKSGRAKAMILYELAEYDAMITTSGVILPIARRNHYTVEMKYLLNILGLAHTYKAEYDKALAYNLEYLELKKKYDDNLSVAIALNNTGLVYYKMKNYSRALEFFEKSHQLRSSYDGERLPNADKDSYAGNLANISLCYSYLNNLDKAMEYIDKTYHSCEDGCPDSHMVVVHQAHGMVHFKRGNMQEASKKFLESLSLARKIKDHRLELDNLICLLEIAIKSNQVLQAEHYLQLVEPLLEIGVPFNLELIKIYAQLFQLYLKLGNYPKVAFYQDKYIQLKDNTFNEQLTTNLMKVESEYQERENKTKIEAQAKILALSNEVISRQRALNLIVVVVALLLAGFVITLIQNVKRKKRSNYILEQRVKERTIELELNHNLLLKSFHERDVQFQRISTEIRSSLATIKGLGVLVSHDVGTVNASNYLAKIEETSNNLMQGLTRVHDQQF